MNKEMLSGEGTPEKQPQSGSLGRASGSAFLTVKIRRTIGKEVRPEAEQIDGKTYRFRYGWTMDDGDPYPGEIAALPDDPNYPKDAPPWIAMGDLSPNAEVSEAADKNR